MNRTALRRTVVRRLEPGETPPASEPKVYQGAPGYKRLRWKIGPAEYVERTVRDDGRPMRRSPRTIDLERARRMYEAGSTLEEIGDVLGCHHGTLSKAMRRAGIPTRSPTAYATPIDEDEVVRLYQEGHGIHAVARMVGVESPRRISAVLHARGVVRGRHRPKGSRDGADPWEAEFQAMREVIRRRSRGRCEARCAADCQGRSSHVHHRKRRGQGGGNRECDLLDTCARCHHWIHHHIAAAYERGLLVHSYDDPANVDVVAGRFA